MKQERLSTLLEVCNECRNCKLRYRRNKLVFGEGNPDAKVMFIGEGPGREEDIAGRPFVGRSGQLLRQLIRAIKLDLEKDVYIANIVKCRPPNNRDPEKEEIDECVKFLKKQIEIIQPQYLVLLGRTAVKGILPDYEKKSLKVSRTDSKAGKITFEEIPVIVTYHPSALLRNPAFKLSAQEDFIYLKNLLD